MSAEPVAVVKATGQHPGLIGRGAEVAPLGMADSPTRPAALRFPSRRRDW